MLDERKKIGSEITRKFIDSVISLNKKRAVINITKSITTPIKKN